MLAQADMHKSSADLAIRGAIGREKLVYHIVYPWLHNA
jgi:hypothetical protein